MVIPVSDNGGKIDAFLRRHGFQQFRILLLLSSGGIKRLQINASTLLTSVEQPVRPGDFVEVKENDEYKRRLENFPAEEFRDYVFAVKPVKAKGFLDVARKFFALDPSKILVDEAETLVGFIRALKT